MIGGFIIFNYDEFGRPHQFGKKIYKTEDAADYFIARLKSGLYKLGEDLQVASQDEFATMRKLHEGLHGTD